MAPASLVGARFGRGRLAPVRAGALAVRGTWERPFERASGIRSVRSKVSDRLGMRIPRRSANRMSLV